MMRALLLAMLVAGCGASSRHMVAPNGGDAVRVKCKGQDNEDCLEEAGSECPGGYSILDQESHSGGLFADTLPGPVRWHSLLIQCK